MDAAGKHGKAKERKEGSAAELSEKMQGDPVCLCVKKNTDVYRGCAGDDQTEQQISACSYFSLRCSCVLPQASPTNLEMDVWMEEAVRAKHIAKRVQSADRFRALLHQLSVPGISYRRSR